MNPSFLICAVLLSVQGGEPAPTQPEPVDLSQLRDITGIEKVEAPPPESYWYIWAGLAAVGLPSFFLVCWKLAGRRRPEPPPPPPDVWALAELDRLEALALPAAGEIDRYHTLLSSTMRRYLELRFQLPASQQTTPEFLKTLAGADLLNSAQQMILGAFLERCDLAKFARAGFSPVECQAATRIARELVEQTAGSSAASSPAATQLNSPPM
jgi:hypothetical protein